jgi:pimeloyl-ACP methyl ester carboxylesterase
MAFAQIGKLSLYYEDHGEDRPDRVPLVLLHGGGSTIGTNFGELIPLLAGSRRVITLEEQGHGHTPGIDRPFTFETSADDVAGLLAELGVARADVLGFSNGGSVALALVTRHPSVVRQLVLASAPFRRDGMIDGFWDMLAGGTLQDMPAVYREEDVRINGDPEHVAQLFRLDRDRMLAFADVPDADLAAIEAPTLVVAGDRDVVTVDHAAALARLIPGARLLVLPATHGDYLGEAAASGGDLTLMRLTAPLLEHFLNATA